MTCRWRWGRAIRLCSTPAARATREAPSAPKTVPACSCARTAAPASSATCAAATTSPPCTPTCMRRRVAGPITVLGGQRRQRVALGRQGGKWVNVNTNLTLTQFTGCDLRPTSPSGAYGGTRDNGTEGYTGTVGWPHLDFGDGGYALIDQGNPNNLIAHLLQPVELPARRRLHHGRIQHHPGRTSAPSPIQIPASATASASVTGCCSTRRSTSIAATPTPCTTVRTTSCTGRRPSSPRPWTAAAISPASSAPWAGSGRPGPDWRQRRHQRHRNRGQRGAEHRCAGDLHRLNGSTCSAPSTAAPASPRSTRCRH